MPTSLMLDPDPALTRDPSGCTAIAALITHDNKIFVVRSPLTPMPIRVSSSTRRLMQAIHDLSSA